MRQRYPALLLACVFLAGPAPLHAAGQAPKPVTRQAVRKLTIPPIVYRHRTLENGLAVYSIQDNSSPTVAIQVWYRVGSKNDPDGRSGFAHLFEHLMYKSTKNMPDEMMDRLTEDVGGFNNATTRDDATQYFDVVPSNYLETLLWAEADRMASLNVNEKNFRSERDVVKEEFRFRILAPPYGRFWYALEKSAFVVHPYRRPGIGSIEDLDAATLEDVQAFHRTFYRPDNAVLVVAGDFDQPQLDAWVDRYFGRIAKPSAPIPRVTVKEPPRQETRRVNESGPNVPLPAIGVTWLIPQASHPDSAALTVAAAVLSLGESSRLYQSLVYDKQIAQAAEADADLREEAGLFIAYAVLASGRSVDEGEKALLAEIEALARKPVTSSELEKAKNQILASVLRQRETNNGKASDLGNAVIVFGDAAEVNKGLERIQAVTPADVQRVMKTYISGGKPVILTYTAAAEKEKGQ
ncbi:MAG TPA: pitrilysin family protein [Thermoanaerobaculia bacterium]|nr:pitrilysin family protein [Thermoanaerobaculia bacterium]